MIKNPIEFFLGIVFFVLVAAGFTGVTKVASSYYQLQNRVALEKLEQKDKRLDEKILKTKDGKEVTRIEVYDFVTKTVIDSLQTKESK